MATIDLLAPGSREEMRAIGRLLMILPFATAAVALWAHARGEPMGFYYALLRLLDGAGAVFGMDASSVSALIV